ncbi:F0F1 ATP synthase subunit B [Ignatzschineria cameli]|uniref:ATP synthase subunit b n=1 Tax=Ignatzschineria cameli TaxID=2182793 RepID=A0A2U2AQZ7_9GAMM|nr:F0F1 ATP synthase subunit B [Ignatzschineria cameli]PWD85259.1 F0F1 ATP synthase subunit B [Ignatzschineria cameli]PWD86316.1 F0F1 ATP synthase subunit B [Ignatzschineria cameli]PWD89846.1 F0F1 ATP synthase subunit B [Ignatzschineria cameli]PWD91496.1 F0F1 ATP synthase subunit B [Ignatzschineria cameli]PWD92534.1 F0F1 ATP synthase subunit B [Ignatzschineria cameli]
MNINATLIAQFIVFFILVLVVMKFIWPPLIKAIEERRAKIAEGLAAAEESVAAQATAEAEVDGLLKQAHLEAATLVSKAQAQADSLIAQSKEESKVVGQREIDAAHAKIEAELSQVKESLRKQVVALSIMGASKIIEKEVDETTHAKMLEELAKQL